MKTIAIILASGVGARLGLDIPKQFLVINGKTVLERSIEAFNSHPKIDEIIIVSHPQYIPQVDSLCKKNDYKKVSQIIAGGKTRQESSSNGINAVKENEANILIHDSVRPFVSKRIIDDCIYTLNKYNAVNVAIESADTIIEIDEEGCIKNIPSRKNLRRVQTPQGFKLSLIKKAHELASKNKNNSFTDDCGIIKEFELDKIKIIQGDESNIKITYPQDIKLAETIINVCDKI